MATAFGSRYYLYHDEAAPIEDRLRSRAGSPAVARLHADGGGSLAVAHAPLRPAPVAIASRWCRSQARDQSTSGARGKESNARVSAREGIEPSTIRQTVRGGATHATPRRSTFCRIEDSAPHCTGR